VLAIGGGFVLTLQLLSKQRELEQTKQQLRFYADSLRLIQHELEAAQRTLDLIDSSTEQELQDLSSSLEQQDYRNATKKAFTIKSAIERRDSAGLTIVHLYAWRPQNGALDSIQNYFQDPAYVVASNETVQDLPSWMGQNSAIYYSDEDISSRAKSMAEELSRRTGTRFVALPVKGKNAPDYDAHDWIRVNYLGDAAPTTK
jgi:hypothetical protein